MKKPGRLPSPSRPAPSSRAPAALCELRVTVPEADADAVSALLIGEGAGGVVEEPAGRKARLVVYGDRSFLDALARALPPARGVAVEVRLASRALDGWDTAWMAALTPVPISRTLLLLPTTHTGSMTAVSRRRVVALEPSLAFGFGEHPTTRLAARAVERAVVAGKSRTVLDVGTGSGVLSIVAAVSGARKVRGIDIDANAVAAARNNAALNGVETCCRFSTTELARLKDSFDLVVANVDLLTLLDRAPRIRDLVARRGTLLLTGFLTVHAREIEARYEDLGLTPKPRRHESGWTLSTLLAP